MTVSTTDGPEFYGPTKAATGDDPALDPPLSMRIEDPAGKFDATVRRAIKAARGTSMSWLVVTGDLNWQVGEWLSDREVQGWPLTSFLVAQAAVRLAQREAGEIVDEETTQSRERGDMDVSAFRTFGESGDPVERLAASRRRDTP